MLGLDLKFCNSSTNFKPQRDEIFLFLAMLIRLILLLTFSLWHKEDIILLLLNGVGPTIESIVNSIKTSKRALTLDNVVCVLWNVEAHLH